MRANGSPPGYPSHHAKDPLWWGKGEPANACPGHQFVPAVAGTCLSTISCPRVSASGTQAGVLWIVRRFLDDLGAKALVENLDIERPANIRALRRRDLSERERLAHVMPKGARSRTVDHHAIEVDRLAADPISIVDLALERYESMRDSRLPLAANDMQIL